MHARRTIRSSYATTSYNQMVEDPCDRRRTVKLRRSESPADPDSQTPNPQPPNPDSFHLPRPVQLKLGHQTAVFLRRQLLARVPGRLPQTCAHPTRIPDEPKNGCDSNVDTGASHVSSHRVHRRGYRRHLRDPGGSRRPHGPPGRDYRGVCRGFRRRNAARLVPSRGAGSSWASALWVSPNRSRQPSGSPPSCCFVSLRSTGISPCRSCTMAVNRSRKGLASRPGSAGSSLWMRWTASPSIQ